MKPEPLPVIGMTDMELNGVLFCEFPLPMSLAESRATLEAAIRECGMTEITPATVATALHLPHWTRAEREPDYITERRAINRNGGRFPPRYVENGADPADPLAMRWNAAARRGEYIDPLAASFQLAKNRREYAARRGRRTA